MTTDAMQHRLGLDGADAAMIRAGEAARRIAAQTGTPMAIWQDGRVVLVPVAPGPPAVTATLITSIQPRP